MVYALKRAIKVEAVRYSRALAISRNRIEIDLVKKLKEGHKSGMASNVPAVRLALYKHFNAKHEGCIIRARRHALRIKRIIAVRNEATRPP